MFGAARALHWRDKRVFPAPKGVGNPLKPLRDWDRGLKLFSVNEEFPVSASHKLALITSLPLVHTARRYYRLNGLVRSSDWSGGGSNVASRFWEDDQTWSFRGSKSRNKVSVGEPAEGSLSFFSVVLHLILYALAFTCYALKITTAVVIHLAIVGVKSMLALAWSGTYACFLQRKHHKQSDWHGQLYGVKIYLT